MTHNELAADLLDYRHHCGEVAVERLYLRGAHWNDSCQADVAAMKLSWTRPALTVYEVKVTRADFQADVRGDKWKKYLRWVERLYFAVPKGMVDKREVPAGAGLIVRGPRGWYVQKAGRRSTSLEPLTERMRLQFVTALLFRHYPVGWDGAARVRRQAVL